MCFEFTHVCTGPLIDQLVKIAGQDKFFMVCIGELNYLYLSDTSSIDAVKGYLLLQGIVVFKIAQSDMMDILKLSGTLAMEHFHGSTTLLESFKIYFNKMQ